MSDCVSDCVSGRMSDCMSDCMGDYMSIPIAYLHGCVAAPVLEDFRKLRMDSV